MTFYNRVKASKIAPIGTIIPWTGGTGLGDRAEDIPKGWIICSLANAVLAVSYTHLTLPTKA